MFKILLFWTVFYVSATDCTTVRLTEEKFLELAKEYYKSNYDGDFEHYLRRGVFKKFKLPMNKNLLKVGGYPPDILNNLILIIGRIRPYRNNLIHHHKLARIINSEGQSLVPIPDPEILNRYKKWENIIEIRDNREIIERDFMEQWNCGRKMLVELEQTLNSFWEIVISEFEKYFFADDPILRNCYFYDEIKNPGKVTGITHLSGIYSLPSSPPFPSVKYNDVGGSADVFSPTNQRYINNGNMEDTHN